MIGGRDDGAPAPKPSLVLVAGSDPIGTTVFSGIVQRLGFYVPRPEVPAGDTDLRGCAESQWVVDFHTRLLENARVHTSDARPAAWAQTARVALDGRVRRQLTSWLGSQFREADSIVIKDPRLPWFLSLWRRCAEDVGAAPRFATVLRHPAAAIDSRQRSYGTWQEDIIHTTGWLNQLLFTERATREAPRVYVRYEDLFDDWARTIGRVGTVLDLAGIRDASWTSMVRVERFLDPSSSRSIADRDALELPPSLARLSDEVWELACRLADENGGDVQPVIERLDAARATYIDLYEEAEAIAQSSVWAAERDARKRSAPRVAQMFPRRLRQKVPVRWRQAALRKITGPG
jgi:hypothetical protein